ncbi:2'-5' RNA ligase family protein [Auraticoccus cholistanensis]|uniref:2'-5' RNA ligase family protein n=1 Tax=Auraticoccus cholistanensis TaxID=2656650 RepID=UPI0018D2478F
MLHLELLPDPATELRLRQDWARLEERGLPNLSRHRRDSNRPHLTVTISADEVAAAGVAPLLPDLRRATSTLPLPLAPAAVSVFGTGPWVLVRTLVVTPALLDLHARVQSVMGRPCVPHLAPGEWVPHTTIARRLDAAQVAAALEVLQPVELAGAVWERARLWDSARQQVTDVPR